MNPLKTETMFPQPCLINRSVFLLIAEVAAAVPRLGVAARQFPLYLYWLY